MFQEKCLDSQLSETSESAGRNARRVKWTDFQRHEEGTMLMNFEIEGLESCSLHSNFQGHGKGAMLTNL